MSLNKARLQEFDILRAIAIILIVYVHLDNVLYSQQLIRFVRLTDGYISLLALSIFFFISGYLLYQNEKKMNSVRDTILYFKRRIIRIFPLYWISLITIVILFGYFIPIYEEGITFDYTLTSIVIHGFGLQGFISGYPMPLLWFVGIILLFYLVFPVITSFSDSLLKTLIVTSGIFLFFICLNYIIGSIDPNFFIYYPLFIAGIVTNQIKLFEISTYTKYRYIFYLVTPVMIGIWGIFLLRPGMRLESLSLLVKYLFLVSLCIASVWFLKTRKPLRSWAKKILSNISYGSYSIYLFHPQILVLFAWLIGHLPIQGISGDAVMVSVGIGLTCYICYYIQKTIDIVLKYKILHRLF